MFFFLFDAPVKCSLTSYSPTAPESSGLENKLLSHPDQMSNFILDKAMWEWGGSRVQEKRNLEIFPKLSFTY